MSPVLGLGAYVVSHGGAVTDTSPGNASPPSGTVTFIGNKNDSFTPSPCTLSGSGSSSSCQTSYTPTAG